MSRKLEGKVAIVLGAAGRDNMVQVIAKRSATRARASSCRAPPEELSRFRATIGGAARSSNHEEVGGAAFSRSRRMGGASTSG